MSINKMICTCSLVLLLASGCSTEKANEWFVTHNGNMPTNERISRIEVGDSKEEVRQILGSPSSVVSFDKNTWIYMSSDVRRIAFSLRRKLTVMFWRLNLMTMTRYRKSRASARTTVNRLTSILMKPRHWDKNPDSSRNILAGRAVQSVRNA